MTNDAVKSLCTGWQPNSGTNSSLLFLCTSICRGQHSHTSMMSFIAQLILWPGEWRHLHSASSLLLTVHHTQLSTVGDWAFPVAAARTWNSLSQHVTAPSISVFWGNLKAFLFWHSFHWLLPQLIQCLCSDSHHFQTLKFVLFTYLLTYLPTYPARAQVNMQ